MSINSMGTSGGKGRQAQGTLCLSTKLRSSCQEQGCGVGVIGSQRFLDGVGVGILRVLGVGVGIFDPTPKVQLN